jgi:ribonucleoside-diphosphate reductase alpha chain
VPLRVLCEKFAHTRFEPSGWTGNPEIGYAKSIMDYIFRWIQIRFLSGTQLDLFAGLQPPASVPVEGTVTAPGNTVSLAESSESAGETASSEPSPSLSFRSAAEESASPSGASQAAPTEAPAPDAPTLRAQHHTTVPSALASLSAAVDASPQAVLQREARAQGTTSVPDQSLYDNGARNRFDNARRQFEQDRTPPQHGIAPEPLATPAQAPTPLANDLAARSGIYSSPLNGSNGSHAYGSDASVGKSAFHSTSLEDRGIYSPAEAMRDMVDMGDAPSCATCGAIMTRSGSCYRCMSCGSTSGCS